jgi:hypothetical protein
MNKEINQKPIPNIADVIYKIPGPVIGGAIDVLERE